MGILVTAWLIQRLGRSTRFSAEGCLGATEKLLVG